MEDKAKGKGEQIGGKAREKVGDVKQAMREGADDPPFQGRVAEQTGRRRAILLRWERKCGFFS